MNRFLQMALRVASTSTCKQRHGAIVVRHGHILGSATNKRRNDPRYVDWKSSSIHAEIAALRRAGFPTRATIYVARINRIGEPRLSKPCANCQEILDAFKVKVVHT